MTSSRCDLPEKIWGAKKKGYEEKVLEQDEIERRLMFNLITIIIKFKINLIV
jgi:hypothetical protein